MYHQTPSQVPPVVQAPLVEKHWSMSLIGPLDQECQKALLGVSHASDWLLMP